MNSSLTVTEEELLLKLNESIDYFILVKYKGNRYLLINNDPAVSGYAFANVFVGDICICQYICNIELLINKKNCIIDRDYLEEELAQEIGIAELHFGLERK